MKHFIVYEGSREVTRFESSVHASRNDGDLNTKCELEVIFQNVQKSRLKFVQAEKVLS